MMLLSCFLCLVLGHRDPGALRQEPFVCRGRPFRVAPWALTRTFCSPPQDFLFFFLLGPRGPGSELECVTPGLNGFTCNDMSYTTRDPPSPPESPRFYVLKGEMLCVFFWGVLAPDNARQVSFGQSFGGWGGSFFTLKSHCFGSLKVAKKSSPCLSLVFRSFIFVTARFPGRFGTRTPSLAV